MNRELEALLLTAAKAIGYGVVGVRPERAAEWGVRVGQLVRAGEVPPGGREKATTTGYYCKRGDGQHTPGQCLAIDQHSPGDGWTRYSLIVLREDSTGHYGFAGATCVRSRAEMVAYLRGIADGWSARDFS